jgi:hypothetical protein
LDASAAKTTKDKKLEAQLSCRLQRHGRGRFYWLVSASAFLGGVLLQLLAAAAGD